MVKVRDLEILVSKGDRHLFKGEYDLAISQYKKAAEIDPDNPAIHFQLGTVHAKRQAYKEAIEEFKSTLKWMPFFYPAIYNLAMCYKSTGNEQKAKSLLEYLSALAKDKDGAITPEMINGQTTEAELEAIINDNVASQ